MSEEVLSIAFVRPHEGHEAELISVLRELYTVLERKQYSRDRLYRDARDRDLLVNFRYWLSEEARRLAQEDPDVHRLWARLGHICRVEPVYERLEEIDWKIDD